MSILNKLMDTMRLTENDDDYFDEEDYEEEKPVIKKRSFGKRDEEMDDYRHEEESKPRFLPRSSNNKVVQMRRSMEVSLIKPTSMEDTREICDYLLAGKAVVLNMEGIHMEVAQRIIDLPVARPIRWMEISRRFPITFLLRQRHRLSCPATFPNS